MKKNVPSPAKQLDQILTQYNSLWRNSDKKSIVEANTSMIAAIERLAPRGTFFYDSLQIVLKNQSIQDFSLKEFLEGIVRSLKIAYESGYLYQVQELIHADLFSDFLEMGEFLLKEGYKDPAAVIIGGVLEEHLRKLCIKNSIQIESSGKPKKAGLMNQELAKSGVYNVLEQKTVTAWLDLRNKAAHGRYDEYTIDHVQLMHGGIRDFISRLPA